MRIRLGTVCSGIGAPEKALSILGLDFELAFFSEIDEAAIRSYCAIHNVRRDKNFGSLTELIDRDLPDDLDLLVGGTPCQDFSIAGQRAGGDEGSGTRSSLMWHYLHVIEKCRPKTVVWENVTGALMSNNYHNYKKFYYALRRLDYAVYPKIVNAKYFNVAQNRERIFVIALRNDTNKDFKYPTGYDSGIRIEDILQSEVPLTAATKSLDKLELYEPDLSYGTHRIIRCGNLHWNLYRQNNIVLSIKGISECLQATNDAATGAKIYDNRPHINPPMIRRFTPLESFRVMGFDDEDYKRCRFKIVDGKVQSNVTESELYRQAGNSIVVPVLAAIFGVLYDVPDWESRVFGHRRKTQKQLLSELPLFRNMNEKNAA